MSEALNQAKDQAVALGLASLKELLEKYNELVIPLVLKAVAEAIPGQLDDMMITAAQPAVQASLKELIAKMAV